jgi:hypothetical protein
MIKKTTIKKISYLKKSKEKEWDEKKNKKKLKQIKTIKGNIIIVEFLLHYFFYQNNTIFTFSYAK